MSNDDECVEKRIYIGGLHESIDEKQVHDRFDRFGKVSQISIAKDMEGKCRGFGHMSITTTENMWKKCISSYNKTKWRGSVLILENAKDDYMEVRRKQAEAEAREAPRRERTRKRIAQGGPVRYAKNMNVVTDNNMGKRRGWQRGRYGRAIAVVRLKRPDGTMIVYDPSHYKNSLTKFDELETSYKRAVQPPADEKDESMQDTRDKEIPHGEMETSAVVTPAVSDEKHFAVNVNLKPLFGGNDEPFKLFGNDDNEAEIEHNGGNSFASSFASSQHKEAELGVMFFFHHDEPDLMDRCFQYDADGPFQRQPEYETRWREGRKAIAEIVRKQRKSAVRFQRKKENVK
ncbi:hypothetical protein BCR43DRAFT_9901 [Syncephalastrum racemosum]|uniref:RRM domain-containing protein n=1 Tax=Syncephalastrum racemosum TaxID=13706 RepID=A0A1X2HTK7_SYNRA|nr:hypothetical protein BCR43DRAFT_9901 [Syncephalastrum racemosum]